MATADTSHGQRERWLPDNPWVWQVVGLGSAGLALLWSRLFTTDADLGRFALLILGLVCLGIGLILRLNTPGSSLLDELSPPRRRRALTWLQLAGAALTASIVLLYLASALNLDIPWTFGQVAFVTVVALPGGLYLFLFAMHRLQYPRVPITKSQEASLLLLLAAVTLFLSSWALWNSAQEPTHSWDTIRMALALFALIAYAGSWLAALPFGWRRFTLSLLVLLHFTAIIHAVLSVPPSPWLIQQGYTRLFRPYYEFMHLGNAYQFYAPEPSPSTQVWFYVKYEVEKDGKKEYLHRWSKIPDINDDGTPNYVLALSFQRRIAMSELVARTETPPQQIQPTYAYRQINSPHPPEPLVGAPLPPTTLPVPLHPELTLQQQFEYTGWGFKEAISGYARHVIRKAHPKNSGAVGVSAKVYRIRHLILSQLLISQDIHPQEPYMFMPYYQGEFDKDGNQLDFPVFSKEGVLLKGDPFVYWLLPFQYDPADSPLKLSERTCYGWVFKHAGDPNWIRNGNRQYWESELKK